MKILNLYICNDVWNIILDYASSHKDNMEKMLIELIRVTFHNTHFIPPGMFIYDRKLSLNVNGDYIYNSTEDNDDDILWPIYPNYTDIDITRHQDTYCRFLSIFTRIHILKYSHKYYKKDVDRILSYYDSYKTIKLETRIINDFLSRLL